MTRTEAALILLKQARKALVDKVVDDVLDDDHLLQHGELHPFNDDTIEAGDRLMDLSRLIYALEDAVEKPAPVKQSNPWVHSETT